MLLGVHCSVSGGLQNAFIEAERLGIDTFQIFTQNQRQWLNKKIDAALLAQFTKAWDHKKVKIIFSHCSYLLNLASLNEEIQHKSIDALIGEVKRCHQLGLSYCVLHPGSYKDQTPETAMKKIITALEHVLQQTDFSEVKILLENTAGQGSAIGYRFEHLNEIIDGIRSKRIGVCFDTCHAFSAGYDLRDDKSFRKTFDEFDKIVGLDNLHAIHINDTKTDLGSRVDRHDNIGIGKLGLECFRLVLKEFSHIPKVLETPKEDNWDEKNLATLRGLLN
ncbi:MAG TPA: deoxyribonuclease IV [Chitinophagaceae bacterium]